MPKQLTAYIMQHQHLRTLKKTTLGLAYIVTARMRVANVDERNRMHSKISNYSAHSTPCRMQIIFFSETSLMK